MEKILIVEDDEEIAFLERDYLEINGYEVDIKSDGEGVPHLVIDGHYDLLILDLMLPGMSGYDIFRQIREKVDMPILMVTAKAETIDKVRGLGLGADDYVTKPFDPAELVARVQSHIKRFKRLNGIANDSKSTNSLSGDVAETDGVIVIDDVKNIYKKLESIQGRYRDKVSTQRI